LTKLNTAWRSENAVKTNKGATALAGAAHPGKERVMDQGFIDILNQLVKEQGAQLSTASSGVDEQNQHSVAHSKRYKDEKMREGFIPSSAPGARRING